MKKLKEKLEKYLKNKLIVDIFVIGSSIKEKFDFRDIDIIVLFREKDYKNIENVLYDIKKNTHIEKLHIEPLIIDNMFNESIFSSLIHEGISIKHGRSMGEIIGYKPFLLFMFSLEGLDNVKKVRFAQTVYGRGKISGKKGILQEEGGINIGRGAFLVPIDKEHILRDVMLKFRVKFKVKRIFVKD